MRTMNGYWLLLPVNVDLFLASISLETQRVLLVIVITLWVLVFANALWEWFRGN